MAEVYPTQPENRALGGIENRIYEVRNSLNDIQQRLRGTRDRLIGSRPEETTNRSGLATVPDGFVAQTHSQLDEVFDVIGAIHQLCSEIEGA